MKIAGAIFDLDGTVLNDEEAYGQAFNAVLKTLGVDSGEKYPQKGGVGLKSNWDYFLSKYKIKTTKSIEELSHDTQEIFLDLLPNVSIKEGFEDLVDQLRSLGIQTALATSNEWHVVEKIFEKLHLDEYFDVTVTGEEAIAAKPDPDIFIIAARKIGVEHEDCVVFEDSEAGVIAARRAKMKVVGIKNAERKENLEKADAIVHDFTEVYKFLESYL